MTLEEEMKREIDSLEKDLKYINKEIETLQERIKNLEKERTKKEKDLKVLKSHFNSYDSKSEMQTTLGNL